MSKPIFIFQIDRFFDSAVDIIAQKESFFGDVFRRLYDLEILPFDLGCLVVFAVREVKDRCKFLNIQNHLSPPEKARAMKEAVDVTMYCFGPRMVLGVLETIGFWRSKLLKRTDNVFSVSYTHLTLPRSR